MRSRLNGLTVVPKTLLTVSLSMRDWGMFVLQ